MPHAPYYFHTHKNGSLRKQYTLQKSYLTFGRRDHHLSPGNLGGTRHRRGGVGDGLCRAARVIAAVHAVFSLGLVGVAELVILTVLVDAEAKHPRRVLLRGLGENQLVVGEQKKVAKGRAEIRAVKVRVFAGARVVGLVAPGAEDFHRKLSRHVGQTHRQHRLALAQRTWASAEVHILKLFILKKEK